ncbi:MAG: HAMP domain-containing sensor histidine kinase, partial [Pseudomonadota bacterium]
SRRRVIHCSRLRTSKTKKGPIRPLQFKQLQENDQSRRELLAQLSHDLRTPLSSVQGYIETIELQHEKLSRDEIHQYVEIALKSTQHLRRLIEQIFELAHLESGQVNVEMESFPLSELLFDIAAKFSIKASDKNIKLLIEPAQSSYQVFTDIGKLERVLSNLIENAIRHTESGGSITLKVKELETENKLCIHVIDNGCGITAQDLPYIFNTRYRGVNARGNKVEHGGFGLAIAQKLLSLLNSKISVRSQPGEGTEFMFELHKA